MTALLVHVRHIVCWGGRACQDDHGLLLLAALMVHDRTPVYFLSRLGALFVALAVTVWGITQGMWLTDERSPVRLATYAARG